MNEQRLNKLESDMMNLSNEVKANTALTLEVKNSVADLVETFSNVKGFWKVLGYIGKAAKPMAWVATATLPIGIWWHELLEAAKKLFH